MSKQLAEQQTEWDLHESTEIVPLEFTEENNVELFGIEPSKAKEMIKGLSTTLAERQVLEEAYIDVITLEITTENLPTFKELRLKIMKNRTQGLTKWKEKEKSFYLAGGNFIQAIYNKEVSVNEEMEAKLMEAEKFFENQEKEKARLLNLDRIEKVKPYIEDVTGLDFSAMSDYDFDDYVLGKKTRFENEAKERKEKEEADLVEKRKDETFQKRQIEIAPYMQFVSDASELRGMTERLYQDLLFNCKKAKIEFDLKVKKKEEENAKLKADAEAKEKALAKERAEAKAKQDAIELKAKQEREQAEKERKIEADKQAKIQAEKDDEIKRLNDEKVKAENDRIAKERADKLEADRLAKAPIKKQLSVWVESFQLPNTEVDNEISKDIIAKFEAFKKWSFSQVNSL